ncbi:MAG: archease [Deltaproteobacteria bacterium]|nr:archease [Deltaproteobacteria bacterium]
MAPSHYELINHTSDVGVRVWGATPEDLFCHAAEAMLDILMDGWATAVKGTGHRVTVDAEDIERLLVKWLQHLIYEFDTKRMVPSSFKITECFPTRLKADITYAQFDPSQHHMKTELKAVTYHQLSVRQTSPHRWKAQVIFDV